MRLILRRFGLYFLARRVKFQFLLGMRRFWMPQAAEVYQPFFNPGELVFDIGANVGVKTKLFVLLGAKVIAVEPLPLPLGELTAVFGSNPSVTILAVGVSDRRGTETLHPCMEEPGLSTMSNRWRKSSRFSTQVTWSQPILVPSVTLDELIDDYGLPAFCKIDIEGWEDRALSGLSRAIPTLSFEFHGEMGDLLQRCVESLTNLDPLYRFAFREDDVGPLGPWVSGEELVGDLQKRGSETQGDVFASIQSAERAAPRVS